MQEAPKEQKGSTLQEAPKEQKASTLQEAPKEQEVSTLQEAPKEQEAPKGLRLRLRPRLRRRLRSRGWTASVVQLSMEQFNFVEYRHGSLQHGASLRSRRSLRL